MRIYEGAPRQDYEEVLRSVGAMLDQRGMREITLNETDDGFIVQGLALVSGEDRQWSDPGARLDKETFQLREDDVSRFMEEALARRRGRNLQGVTDATGQTGSGFYETALRVAGPLHRPAAAARRVLLRAGPPVRDPTADAHARRAAPRAGRVHARRARDDDLRGPPGARPLNQGQPALEPLRYRATVTEARENTILQLEVHMKGLIKLVAVLFVVLLAAVVVVPSGSPGRSVRLAQADRGGR